MAEKTDDKDIDKTPEAGSDPDKGTPKAGDQDPKKPEEVTPSDVSPLDEAKKINEETAKLNAERIKILDREEKLHAEKMVGGRGQVSQKEETDDQKWSKDAKERYEGTGMDPTPIEDSGPTKYS